jgi:hypothetical protein
MDARELLTHPLTLLATVGSLLGSIGFGLIDPAWGLVSATSGMWFPAVAVTAGTILPEIGYGDLGTQVLVAAAIVFVAVQLDRLYDRGVEWYRNRYR